MAISPDTLLRRIRQSQLPVNVTPRVLELMIGIRRGHRYVAQS